MMRVIDFKNLILTSKDYDEQFTKSLLETIIETRVQAERDENDYKRKQEGMILELERMKLSMTATSTNTSASAAEKINIQHLIPRFVENSDIPPILKYLKGSHIKQVLLQRFKLSAESFRMKVSAHQKQPEALWKDFAYELNYYLVGWLHSLEVKDFNSLKDLVLTDQLKKRVSKEVKEHFVDIWGDIKNS
ncbi:retrovirus-related Pol polyprotein from transposon 17.6 [Trichonephila clavipes]|nr:retrovirus-related Pol polyprotein from transposon 17.6 [Trichonephila clavipes]